MNNHSEATNSSSSVGAGSTDKPGAASLAEHPKLEHSTSPTDSLIEKSTWQTGVLKRFPWEGFAGLLVIILCSVGSILVLVYSDGTPQKDWVDGYAAPNVILEVLNSISSLAIGLAIAQGVAICWWLRALAGNTVEDLHYSWAYSNGVENIIKKIKRFNFIALAALMTKVAVIDGALYQKATSTYISTKNRLLHENITAFGASVFAPSGVMGDTANADGTTTSDFNDEVTYWTKLGSGVNQNIYIEDCNGLSCKYGLQGAGFAVECTNQSTLIDYGTSARAAFAQNNTAGYRNLTLFSVNFTRSWSSAEKNYSSFFMEIVQPSIVEPAVRDGACPLELIRTTCELRPALLNYTVYYTNGTSVPLSQLHGKGDAPLDYSSYYSYDPTNNIGPLTGGTQMSQNCAITDGVVTDPDCGTWDAQLRQAKGTSVIRNIDINEPFIPGALSSLEGFYLSYRNALTARASLSYNGSDWFLDQEDGTVSAITVATSPPAGFCDYTWVDPQRFLLNRINTLTLMIIQQESLYYPIVVTQNYSWGAYAYVTDPSRALYNLSTAALTNQTVPALVEYKDIYYQTTYKWMYAALAVSLVVILGIMPVYWGFWRLGRNVTLGPFEIANAFRGPIFNEVQGDRVDDILKQIGQERIVYGHTHQKGDKHLTFETA